jgi:hypothetical protein
MAAKVLAVDMKVMVLHSMGDPFFSGRLSEFSACKKYVRITRDSGLLASSDWQSIDRVVPAPNADLSQFLVVEPVASWSTPSFLLGIFVAILVLLPILAAIAATAKQ